MVQADEDGRYAISSVDASMQYALVIAAEGFAPAISPLHDPADGPLHMRLVRRPIDSLRPAQRIKARVLGADGRPLEGAAVEPGTIYQGGWKGQHPGSDPGVDLLAVTNARGEFVLAAKDAADGMDLVVRAPDHAQMLFPRIATDGGAPDLRLITGAAIRGHVLKDGQPVPRVEVGLCTAEPRATNPERHWLRSGPAGEFEFLNLNPDRDYFVYVGMESARDLGAAVPRTVHAGADKSWIDAGDLELSAGHRLAGRIAMPAGAAIPHTAALFLSDTRTDDLQSTEIKPDGSFALTQIPAGVYSLGVAMVGYQPSPRNPSYSGGHRLMGKITGDLDSFVILMEPAATPSSSDARTIDAPLKSYEPPGSHTPARR
jgi:hypothetical protein